MKQRAPWLNCPACTAPAFEAEPCDQCGEDECVCDGTGWLWYETEWMQCVLCGARIRVRADDSRASVEWDEDWASEVTT